MVLKEMHACPLQGQKYVWLICSSKTHFPVDWTHHLEAWQALTGQCLQIRGCSLCWHVK